MSLPGKDEKYPMVDHASVRGRVQRSQSAGYNSRGQGHHASALMTAVSQPYGSTGSDNAPASPYLTNSIKKQMRPNMVNTDLHGGGFASSTSAAIVDKDDPHVASLVNRESLFKFMWEGRKTDQDPQRSPRDGTSPPSSSAAEKAKAFLYYIVYALVNVIISGKVVHSTATCFFLWSSLVCMALFRVATHLRLWSLSCAMLCFVLLHTPVPGLYGYTAVIFSHEVFLPHRNALSKLVIFSSLIHQLGFSLFSSLPFAIGTVQDAGLIFLSTMSSKLATEILADGGTDEVVLSTVLVLLGLGTATLGLLLIAVGHFRLAE